jgi:hypothetical protein
VDPATNTAIAVAGTSVVYATELVYADLDAIAFGEYMPCGAVKVRDDDTALTSTAIYSDAHLWFGGGPGKSATAAVCVAKTGADTLDGLHTERPKLTIGAAITAADALITAGATKVRIEVLDAGIYSESIVLSPMLILHAPAATLIGLMTIDDGCSVLLDKHYVDAVDSQTLIAKVTTGTGEVASYRANIVDGRGTGGAVTSTTCIQNESETSVIFCWVGQIFVPSGGSGIRDTAGAGFGHTHFILNDLYLAGNNAIGIRNTNANTNQIGYIDHILEIGTPTGTTGILFTASGGVAKITASEITADTAYDISGGSLYLSCPKVTGTRTGTPAIEISNALVKTDTVRAATTTLQILGTDGVPGIQIAADGAVKMGAETGDVWIEGLGSDTPGVRSPGLMIGYSNTAILLRFRASGGLAIDTYDSDPLVDAWVEAFIIEENGSIRLPAIVAKTTPIDADSVPLIDSVDSNFLKNVTWANIKATLTTLFNSLYLRLAGVAGGQTAYGGNASGDDLYLRSTSHATKGFVLLADDGGRVGIGTDTPLQQLQINDASTPVVRLSRGAGGRRMDFAVGPANATLNSFDDGTAAYKQLSISADPVLFDVGNLGVGALANAKLHVDQASTTAAIPVLILDQADLSEEMIEFVTTVGTGNPIEAVGAKTLTTTHFIRVTIPGVGYRYIPAGTIA